MVVTGWVKSLVITPMAKTLTTLFFKAASSRAAFYMMLQAAGAAQVLPIKLPQQRAFASVYI